ncbi:MAG: hypothetical protein Q4P20_10890 [Eubacteriales bacterium]|nr:hypothetical protein [Eubacteriales bacterium]
MIEITIAAICGAVAGWCLCKKVERIRFSRRYRRSVRICARSNKRKRPRRVVTAGDDYI